MIKKLIFLTLCLLFTYFMQCIVIAGSFITEEEESIKYDWTQQSSETYLFLDKENRGDTIFCYDVNEQGYLAVGFLEGVLPSVHKKILVYDQGGNFCYGYSIRTEGDSSFEWKEGTDHILYYFTRGESVIEFDNQGNYVSRFVIVNRSSSDRKQNARHWSEIRSNVRMVNNQTYTLQYSSRIIHTNADGTTTVLYDVSGIHTFIIILRLIAISLFLWIVFKMILQTAQKHGKNV